MHWGGGFRNKNPASSVPVTIGPSRRGWRRLPRERMLLGREAAHERKGGRSLWGRAGVAWRVLPWPFSIAGLSENPRPCGLLDGVGVFTAPSKKIGCVSVLKRSRAANMRLQRKGVAGETCPLDCVWTDDRLAVAGHCCRPLIISPFVARITRVPHTRSHKVPPATCSPAGSCDCLFGESWPVRHFSVCLFLIPQPQPQPPQNLTQRARGMAN